MSYPSNYGRALGLNDPFFGDVFNRFFGSDNRLLPTSDSARGLSPNVDIVEKDDCYQLITDLPGYKKDEVDVDLHDGVLSIRAEHSESSSEEKKEDGYTILRSERHSGHYERRFTVGDAVDTTGVSAALENGVLTVNLPKASQKEPAPKKISVS